MDMFMTAEFWVAVGQIIMIDILLGGDNAVVIALACRKLPPKQRTQGILWGTAGAIVLRIVLIFFALHAAGDPVPEDRGRACCWSGSASSCWCRSTRRGTPTSKAATGSGARSRR